MNELNEDELRVRFANLRTTEERRTPDFQRVLDRAKHRPQRSDRFTWRRPSRLAVSAALAAAILVAVGVERLTRRSEFVPPPLSTWVSPTASLLRTPGSDLLTSQSLHTSILASIAPLPVVTKGKSK